MPLLHTYCQPEAVESAVLLAEARSLATGGGRLIRESANLSLGDVARACDVAPSTVMRWERGERRPTGQPALRYVELLRALANRGKR